MRNKKKKIKVKVCGIGKLMMALDKPEHLTKRQIKELNLLENHFKTKKFPVFYTSALKRVKMIPTLFNAALYKRGYAIEITTAFELVIVKRDNIQFVEVANKRVNK